MDIQTVSFEFLVNIKRRKNVTFPLLIWQIELNPEVQSYLDEHLLRSFSTRHVLVRASYGRSQRSLRRRMSVKGTIKKKISINVDCEYFSIIYT